MEIMPVWATSIAAVVGVIYAIVRNGTRSKKQDTELKMELKNDINGIRQKLDNPNTGLEAIKKSADDMKVHCAKTSTALITQSKVHDNEIYQLRERMDKE